MNVDEYVMRTLFLFKEHRTAQRFCELDFNVLKLENMMNKKG